jgi:hypothetical protein
MEYPQHEPANNMKILLGSIWGYEPIFCTQDSFGVTTHLLFIFLIVEKLAIRSYKVFNQNTKHILNN